MITPVFKDMKNGKYKVISFFAKKARGQMARYAIDKRLEKVNGPEEVPSSTATAIMQVNPLRANGCLLAKRPDGALLGHNSRCRHVRHLHGHQTPRGRGSPTS